MNTYCIIQDRLGSTRFPRKTFKNVFEELKVIDILYKRVSQTIPEKNIIYAIPDTKKDDELESYLYKNHRYVGRGPEKNVLKRVTNVGEAFEIQSEDIIVEITGDCPLICPMLLDDMLKCYESHLKINNVNIEHNNVYLSNTLIRSYPDGFDIQIYPFRLLQTLNTLLSEKHQHREHVGWNIPAYLSFHSKIINYVAELDYFYPHLAVTVDYEKDLFLIQKILNYFQDIFVPYDSIIDYLKTREHNLINKNLKRNIPGAI